MKRILGLDLGSSSIGWAIVDFDSKEIIDMGSRIIPLTPDDETRFSKGQAITKNADRTTMRTARKGNDRYQMRRSNLKELFAEKGITPADLSHPIDLWQLRSKAATEKIRLNELERVLLHINKKRGYKAGKADYNDASSSKYVKEVNGRYESLTNNNLTIGQYFYEQLKEDGSFRVKDRVYPRIAYLSEFDRIMDVQKEFYPEVLREEFVRKLRDETIFYQRRLKSCKHLVSVCEFEKKEYDKADGTKVLIGPKVAPKSSPVAQLCKIWEAVNDIILKNHRGEKQSVPLEQKQVLVEFLNKHLQIKNAELQKILGISNNKDWKIDKTLPQRNIGNSTYIRIKEALNGKYTEWLQLNVSLEETVDKETGEVRTVISESIKTEPLFRLWHTLYSIDDAEELRKVLKNKFHIEDEEVLERLCRIDFVKEGYAGKSNTAMRKILPYLMEGKVYSEACKMAGYNHSNSMTKEENLQRTLKDSLSPIKKGEMRQPIVEKVLNQMVNLVNALLEKYGRFDEIRVELARELKQSREERESTSKTIAENEKENKKLAEKVEEYGYTPTRNRILKMKLWEETQHLCVYCNQPVNVGEFLFGIDVEKEHIIPKSLLFDNSSSNVTCSCRKCNQEKENMTAYDFMKTKGEEALKNYVERIKDLLKKKQINKPKHDKLLMPQSEIPQDFIERQLRETQYVSKKALELLKEICRNVYATSGSVTDFLRHVWGWDEILHNLHFDQYKSQGMTEMKEFQTNGQTKTKEVIKGWTKRLDHRHHAIDALTIACTSQGMIQQLNSLNTLKDVPFTGFDAQAEEYKEKHGRLEKYVLAQPHFSYKEVKEAVENILVSFKRGKKVVTPGKRYAKVGGKRVAVQNTLVPRGALHEETIRGKINVKEKKETKKFLSELSKNKYMIEKIADKEIKKRIIDYLEKHNGKFVNLLDCQGKEIKFIEVFEEKIVVKKSIYGKGEDKKEKNAFNPEDIVDGGIKKRVIEYLKNHNGKFVKDDPLRDQNDRIIRSVRVFSKRDVQPVRFNDAGDPIGYAELKNNHHIALYKDFKGKVQESLVTFLHAVERKRYGLPVIITNPMKCYDNLPENLPDDFLGQLPDPQWKFLLSIQQNEMFVLGMEEEEYKNAVANHNYAELGKHLYRVQKISAGKYTYRHHLETSVDDEYDGKKNETLSKKLGKRIQTSRNELFKLNPHKVHISNIGEIIDD